MRLLRNSILVALLTIGLSAEVLSVEVEVKKKSQNPSPLLDSHITFQATFNETLDANKGHGDKQIYTAESLERKTSQPGLRTTAVEWDKENGKTGGCLRFNAATKQLVYFKGGTNLPYKDSNFTGTVSFWMKLSPKEDLPKGYVDPLQITDKKWNDASFFVDFDQSEERPFRLGSFSNLNFWNPQKRKFEEIPDKERPMVTVKDWPFKRTEWTHVAFTWEKFNTDDKSKAKLFLNGKPQGELTTPMKFTWEPERAVIMLGINYVGWLDDLTIFNRSLTDPEIKLISQ